jgi:MFS family permease
MATVFMDMVGFLMVLPLLPFYAEALGADPVVVTLLVAIFALAQLVTAPLWGRFSDSLGRRPMIILGLVVSAVAFAIFGYASSLIESTAARPDQPQAWGLGLLFLSRLIQGVGGGTTGVVQAYVSDVVSKEDRAKALGWLSAATSAGVTIGPFLGSLSARWGAIVPGALAAALCLLNALSAWRWLPEPNDAVRRRAESDDPAGPGADDRQPLLESIAHVLAHPGRTIHQLIFIYAFGMMAFMAMNSVFALFLERRFGVTEETIGYFYVYVGAMGIVMRALLLGPIVARLGEVRTLRLGAISLGLGLFAIPWTGTLGLDGWSSYAVFGLVVALVPIGTALLFPATTSQVSGRAREGETGQTLGVQQLFGGVARVIGPIWAGFAFRDWGIPTPFWIGAGIMACVLLLSFNVHPLGRDPEERQDGSGEAGAAGARLQ